jgi:ParB family chromosome partitioning protein
MKIEDAKMILPTKNNINSSAQKRISLFNEKNRRDLLWVDLESIKPFKYQAREYFSEEELVALSKSIKEFGVLNPLILSKRSSEDQYEVISGERRLRASKMAGLKKVPAFVVSDEKEASLISVIDNIQRENLHPIEFAKSCQLLLDNNVCNSTQDVADSIGVSKSKVVEALGLLKIPEELRSKIVEKNITARAILRALTKINDVNAGLALIEESREEKHKKNKKIKSLDVSFIGGEVKLIITSPNLITKTALDGFLEKVKEKVLEVVAAATT